MNELEKSKAFILKCSNIIRGLDSDYKFGSDKLLNVQSYIHSFAKESPELYSFLENNKDMLSDISELHPQRINFIIECYKKWI